jgi:hypothetical protein
LHNIIGEWLDKLLKHQNRFSPMMADRETLLCENLNWSELPTINNAQMKRHKSDGSALA